MDIFHSIQSQLGSCPTHHLSYQYYSNATLLCGSCPSSPSRISLESILLHPITLLLPPPTLSHYMALLSNKTQACFTLKQLLNKIKSTVSAICDELIAKYDYESEIRRMDEVYRECLYGLLDGSNISRKSMEEIFQEYRRTCVSPISKIEEMREVEWGALIQMYETVTDRIMYEPRRNGRILINGIRNQLTNGGYSLQYDEKGVRLYGITNDKDSSMEDENTTTMMSMLTHSFDTIYEIDRYRLVGVDYSKVIILSYGTQSLDIVGEYPIDGCREVLSLGDQLIVLTMAAMYSCCKNQIIPFEIQNLLVYLDNKITLERMIGSNSAFLIKVNERVWCGDTLTYKVRERSQEGKRGYKGMM